MKKKTKKEKSQLKAQTEGTVNHIRGSSDEMLILLNSVINTEMVNRLPQWKANQEPVPRNPDNSPPMRGMPEKRGIFTTVGQVTVILGAVLIGVALFKSFFYPTEMDYFLLGAGVSIFIYELGVSR